MIPLDSQGTVALVDEIDLLPALMLSSWCLNSSGYATATVNNQCLFLHWFVAKRMGLSLEKTIDHKNRNKLDCRRENLQEATYTEQLVNRGMQSNNNSGHKCICWHSQRKKWHVQVKRNGVRVHIALCKTLEEAIEKRDAYLKRFGLELI